MNSLQFGKEGFPVKEKADAGQRALFIKTIENAIIALGNNACQSSKKILRKRKDVHK